jgi:ABC-type methionine transport system ATPase subunit
MRLVRHLASRVVVIDAGEIVEDATTDQLLHNPESQAARSIVESDRRRQAIFAEARGLIGMIA